MKPNLLFCLAAIIFAPGIYRAAAQQAPPTQSAIFDAIALMNAERGINVIMMPDASNYQVIDPVTGVKTAGQTGPLPAALTNPANSTGIVMQILSRNAGLPNTATAAQINAAYAGNPFLSNILSHAHVAIAAGSPGALPNTLNGFAVPPASGAAGVNLLNNLANGAADFLIKRAGQELSVSIIQKLQDFVGRYPEFKMLFPKTLALIKPIAPYDYAKTLNALKAALQDDLDQIPSRIPQLYQIQRYKILNQKAPVLTLVFGASSVYTGLNGKNGLSRTLHDIDTCGYLAAQNNYASFIHLLSLTSDGLRKKTLTDAEDKDYAYITADEIKQVTNDDPTNKELLVRFFLGLLYQKAATLPIWTATGQQNCGQLLIAWATDNRTNLTTLLDAIDNAAANLTTLEADLRAIKNNDMLVSQVTGKPTFSIERFADYNQLVVTSLKVLQPFVAGTDSQSALKQEVLAVCNYWPSFSGDGIGLVKAMSQKDYSLAVQDLSNLLQVVVDYLGSKQDDAAFAQSLKTDMNAALNADIAAIQADLAAAQVKLRALVIPARATPAVTSDVYAQEQMLNTLVEQLQAKLAATQWQQKNGGDVVKALTKVLQYYQLFAALSTAGNSQEVESLLETYALPSGSSRVKKETDFNIALNAYVGGFFARNKTAGTGFTNKYGLTAPIGFTVSHGFGSTGSASLLLGAFDIGGVIGYKLNNQGAYEQNISLAGLVSPSAHVVYGFPFYLPLSIGAGCQWTSPQTAGSNNIHLSPHFNMFIAVDIPLFNLTAARKKR